MFQFWITVKSCLRKHEGTSHLRLVFHTLTTITYSKLSWRQGADAILKRKIKSVFGEMEGSWHLLKRLSQLLRMLIFYLLIQWFVSLTKSEGSEWPMCFLQAARQCLWNEELRLSYFDRLFINRRKSDGVLHCCFKVFLKCFLGYVWVNLPLKLSSRSLLV